VALVHYFGVVCVGARKLAVHEVAIDEHALEAEYRGFFQIGIELFCDQLGNVDII
jgi:hypothetical protein